MDKDIKDLLNSEAKNNMPDLWDKIECKLPDKNKIKVTHRNRILVIAASLAIVFTVGLFSDKLQKNKYSNMESVENKREDKKDIAMLEDLNLEKILEDKTIAGGMGEASKAYDKRFIDYQNEAQAVIYGKVVEVKSYVDQGIFIVSDIKIEVIKDYKNNILEKEYIILGNAGGEATYQEFIDKSYESIWKKRGYDTVEDKSKKLIELCDDGIPQYRVGEYVLVYTYKVDKNEVYAPKEGKYIEPPRYDYFALKKLYANPNTNEVFKYKYDLENNKLIKEKVTSLGEVEDFYN